MQSFRIAIAQMNSTVGDIQGNAAKILTAVRKAQEIGAQLVVFPELALTGYPPEDLLLKPKFVEENERWARNIASKIQGVTAIFGFVDKRDDVFNAACIVNRGTICGVYHKMYLPNYSVFDEERYFRAGNRPMVVRTGQVTLGISICEDIWHPVGPIEEEAGIGQAEVIINLSASPYYVGKVDQRERMLRTRAQDHDSIVVFANLVGGQDELVFDGNSLIIDEWGEILARGKAFEEDLVWADVFPGKVFSRRLHDPRRRRALERRSEGEDTLDIVTLKPQSAGYGNNVPPAPGRKVIELPDLLSQVYSALSLGLHDYVKKNGFERVVVGLSGGIDSALVATICRDTLGPENVVGVSMPSRFTSDQSIEDARMLAGNLGIAFHVVPIESTFAAYLETLREVFGDRPFDIAEENLQARIRGNILMALSNKFGWLVITTGNKSEMSVGYATLYGDMAGGFALLKDVPKTLVYELANYRNNRGDGAVIPESIISRPPTAELRPNQKDTDSLPPYDVLDPIIEAYVEEDVDIQSLAAMGYPPELVRKVANMVTKSEYKRRQAPPGVKITQRAFGRDRRFPLTNRFVE